MPETEPLFLSKAQVEQPVGIVWLHLYGSQVGFLEHERLSRELLCVILPFLFSNFTNTGGYFDSVGILA